jgi:hypothetical protein
MRDYIDHTDQIAATGPHPLLAQVPLTVSPFISLPTAVTLPYTYKTVSSALPPSATIDPAGSDRKARYVVSSSGHAAHPDDILASCQALEDHLKKTQAEAEKLIKEWDESVKQRELAEKRRVAPGWLDREEKLLQPTQVSSTKAPSENVQQPGGLDNHPSDHAYQGTAMAPGDERHELDRALGSLALK